MVRKGDNVITVHVGFFNQFSLDPYNHISTFFSRILKNVHTL